MEFKIYRETEDYNYDTVYGFLPLGKSKNSYETNVTIDWLNSDVNDRGNIIRLSCNCQDYERRRRTCKHLTECMDILYKDHEFVLKKDALKRYWCSTCHSQIDTNEEEPKCYKCKTKMLESDVK